jgi:hypothetical protein
MGGPDTFSQGLFAGISWEYSPERHSNKVYHNEICNVKEAALEYIKYLSYFSSLEQHTPLNLFAENVWYHVTYNLTIYTHNAEGL